MTDSGETCWGLSDLIETFGLHSLFKSQPWKGYCTVKGCTGLAVQYELGR